MKILKVDGTSEELYTLVAPLVMNPAVLRANYGFPFKTSERYLWIIAQDDAGKVLGFMPIEQRTGYAVINNYYIVKEERAQLLPLLLKTTLESYPADTTWLSYTFAQDKELFEANGFVVEKAWRRYIKMIKQLG